MEPTNRSNHMPRPRFENADPALRQAILDAAAREFSERGYDGASLNQIIEASGLSKGSFYYYFDDKLDLAATVFVQATQRMAPALHELEAATSAEDFWRRFDAMNARGMERLLGSPLDLKLVGKLGGAYVDHPELAAKVTPLIAELSQRFLKSMAHGVALGAVRADVPLPLLMAAAQAMKESLVRAFMGGGAEPSQERLATFAAITMDLNRRIMVPDARLHPKKEES